LFKQYDKEFPPNPLVPVEKVAEILLDPEFLKKSVSLTTRDRTIMLKEQMGFTMSRRSLVKNYIKFRCYHYQCPEFIEEFVRQKGPQKVIAYYTGGHKLSLSKELNSISCRCHKKVTSYQKVKPKKPTNWEVPFGMIKTEYMWDEVVQSQPVKEYDHGLQS